MSDAPESTTRGAAHEGERSFDPYRTGSTILWCGFFLVGLAPVEVFWLLREAGRVVTQNALTNSAVLITLALAGYVGLFIYRVAREHQLPPRLALAYGAQCFLLGLVAFSTLSTNDYVGFFNIPSWDLRMLLLAAGACKAIAWAQLFTWVLRYHAMGPDALFKTMPCIFPSARGQRAAGAAGESARARPASTEPR